MTPAPAPVPAASGPVLEGVGIECRFGTVRVLSDASVALHPGELVVLLGPSGSGKTSLLNILCGFARPDRGSVLFGGQPVDPARLGWAAMAVVPQALGLLGELTVRENVALPSRLTGGAVAAADELLAALDVALLGGRLPAQLSLGECQRVAVARAFALSPAVVLADEPTSHQDATRTTLVLDLVRRHCRSGAACLVATHDEEVIGAADRVLVLAGGRPS